MRQEVISISRGVTLTASAWTCGFVRQLVKGDMWTQECQQKIDRHNGCEKIDWYGTTLFKGGK